MTKTTIQLNESTKQALQDERLPTESNYNETIERLLHGDKTRYVTEAEVREVVSEMVVLEALE